jgi:hypothetical protein
MSWHKPLFVATKGDVLRKANFIYMNILPTPDVPHQIINVYVFVEPQFDGRGRSKSKTAKLLSTISAISSDAIVTHLWGKATSLFKLVAVEVEIETKDELFCIIFKTKAPCRSDNHQLVQMLASLWGNILQTSYEVKVQCFRHYTADEILEHCW